MVIAVLAALTAGIGPSFAAEPQPSAVAHVALLEAEYITPDAKAARRELTGWLDTVLTENLSRQKGLVLVDRQALNKVLTERNIAKLDARTADARLRPFIASGVLICPMIVADAKSGKGVATVQAVLAQRGTLLAEMTAVGELAGDGWKTAPALDQPLKQFWQDMRRQLETNLSLPGLEVRRIRISSKLDRLQWMADDLTDAVTVAPREGLILLVPRQPIHTKEERLLRLMGLGNPGDGDKSAKLSAASDFQLSGELVEEVKVGMPFDQTPVKITLNISGGGKELARRQLAGTVGKYPEIRQQALAWATKELSRLARIQPQVLDESHAKALAQQELAVARRLAAVSYGASSMERDRQERLAMTALRACHLDPASEEAAYLAATCIEGMYEARQQGRTLACKDRIIQLCRQYSDRFGDKVAKHHREMLARIGSAGHSGAWIIRGKPGGTDAIVRPPDVRQYPYASAYVRAWMEIGIRAETDKNYGGSNSLQAAPGHLLMHLIPSIPDDKLDGGYLFWRELWQQRVAPLGEGKCIPWDCVEMGFAARRKDARGVRAAAQRLAAKYPQSRSEIWRLLRDNTVTLYLRATGDPQWNTWQPKWPQGDVLVIYADRLALYRRFAPPALDVMDLEKIPPLEGLTKLAFDEDVLDRGRRTCTCAYPRIQPIAIVGAELWLITPGLWDTINCKQDHTLFAVNLDQIALNKPSIAIKATQVEWPAQEQMGGRIIVTCYLAGADAKTFWVGTEAQGLVKFARKDGRWVGRWMGPREGLPVGRIAQLAWGQTAESAVLMVRGLGPGQTTVENGRPAARKKPWLCEVDPILDKVRTLEEPKESSAPRQPLLWATTTQDGKVRQWQMPAGRFYGGDRWRIRQVDENGTPKLPTIEGRTTLGRSKEFGEYAAFQAPVSELRMALGLGNSICTVSHWKPGPDRNEGEVLMIYQPARDGDKNWASHDRWIGPFLEQQCIFAVMADEAGRLWVTTGSGVFVVDWRAFLGQYGQQGFSTQQWRLANSQRRERADWQVRVRQLLAEGQAAKAMELVNKQQSDLGQVDSSSPSEVQAKWTIVQLHKAMLLERDAKMRQGAIDLYQELATCQWIEPAARERSWACMIEAIAKSRRWTEAIQAAETAAQTFPRILSDSPDRHSCRWTVDRARQELKKASRPAATGTQPSR